MSISVCLIYKNEARYLEEWLSELSFAEEIIAVDTGSTDNSRALLNDPRVTHFEFEWTGSFSAARNFSLEQATKEWILVLDADERVVNPEAFQDMLANPDADCFQLTMRNMMEAGSLVRFEDYHMMRFFRNKDAYRYEGVIHEQIVTALEANEAKAYDSELTIVHLGYQQDEVQGGVSRKERNIVLLEQELALAPEDPYWNYHLALTLQTIKPEESYAQFEKTLGLEGELSPQLENQIHMRMTQLSLQKNDVAGVLRHGQRCLENDESNIIARVCLITALMSVNGFEMASPHLNWMVQNGLDRVANPDDFLTLQRACSELLTL